MFATVINKFNTVTDVNPTEYDNATLKEVYPTIVLEKEEASQQEVILALEELEDVSDGNNNDGNNNDGNSNDGRSKQQRWP